MVTVLREKSPYAEFAKALSDIIIDLDLKSPRAR